MTEVPTPTPMLPIDDQGSVTVDEQSVLQPEPKRGSWWKRCVLGLLAGVVLFGGSLVVPARTFGQIVPGRALVDQGAAVTKPGSARPVSDRVKIRDGSMAPAERRPVFEPEGEFLFTTVSVDLDVSVFDWIESEFNDEFELRPLEHILGDRTPEENRTRNSEMMSRSKDDAVTVALEFLGVPIVETGVGFNVVVDGGPADGLLMVGDVIVAVDGVAISSLQSLRDELTGKVPGEGGVVTVEHDATGEVLEVPVVWGEHPQGVEGGYIGIGEVVSRVEDSSVVDVEIDTGSTGGPSAGLAFSLAIIDLLTEGELTGGQTIAVTGQIFVGGIVGNVGGVAQKAVAARSAGAVAFIVPEGLVAAAESQAGGMKVFGVSTLEEAIDVLAELGGDTDDLTLDGSSSDR